MKRTLYIFLQDWLNSRQRKPLVLRGARQVGKTWIVRELAKKNNKNLIEINFEKNPELQSLFTTNDVKKILLNLSTLVGEKIKPKENLLFLDEIQVVPELLAKLRWFMEDLPELAVITAGSLLEFVLEQHTFSMPVGRIQYLHLGPMSFEEFLEANEKTIFVEFLKNDITEIPGAIHEELLYLFREYIIVGGMPAAVLTWIEERNISKVKQIQYDLLNTYRDDFAKYTAKIDNHILDSVMQSVPRMLGEKFVYKKVSETVSTYMIKNALDLLNKSRVIHAVQASAANGIPLGSEVRDKFFKEIFLDTGLANAMLGLTFVKLDETKEINLVNKGAIAEQVVGQLIKNLYPPYVEPNLFYWLREEKGSNAEIDYVIELNNTIIPIEVKAGSTGSLKSLHVFMGLKKLPLAIRINSDIPRKHMISIDDSFGNKINYTMLSIPFYLIHEIPRLVKEENQK